MQATAVDLHAHITRNHVQRALLRPPTVLCMRMIAALAHTPRAGAEKSASDAHHATPSLGLLFLGPEGRGEEDALSRVSLCVSVELENLNMELCGRNRAAASSAVSGAAGADAVARIHVGRFCPRFRAASALSAPPPIFPCLQLHRNIHLCLHVFCCNAAWSMTSGTRVTGESSGD